MKISPCCSRVLAGERGTLHEEVLTHTVAASTQILLATAAAKDGELRHFDAGQTFLKVGIGGDFH